SATPVTFREIPMRVGRGWTRFWFTPSDPIVLSLLRALVGLVALWWYLSILPNLQEWFGPNGIFPLSMAMEWRGDSGFAISILDYVHTGSQLWLVYILGLISILMMVFGLLTRITTIAAFLFVLSFIHRAPMMSRPVDDLLPLLMFYLCLGPAGASFSIDSVIRKWRQPQDPGAAMPAMPLIQWSSAATVAIRLIQIHLALIYGAMLIAQLQGAAWWQGTAVWWLMARPESRLVNLTFLSGTGEQALTYMMNLCTYAVLLYELCFAVLIWNPLARPILLVAGVLIWGGLALVGGAISFCVLMFVANLAFLPAETLRRWSGSCPVA
ncbi:MAG TPA: hypothetical protein VGI75_01765, partial [Pirellulales bacterium]